MTSAAPTLSSLQPLPYHRRMLEYLQRHETFLLERYRSAAVTEEEARAARLELLKAGYRLPPEAARGLYDTAERVKADFGYAAMPLEIYQMHGGAARNLLLQYVPDRLLLGLAGDARELLTAEELAALLAHEIGHFHFNRTDGGMHHRAAAVLGAIQGGGDPDGAFARSFRLHSLFTEMYCDRAALAAGHSLAAAVGGLVKIETGLRAVDAAAYLKQSEEILAAGASGSDGVTHPESYLRARALALWAEQGNAADAAIETLVAGAPTLTTLDLAAKIELTAHTRLLLGRLLRLPALRTDAALAHCRLFLPDFDAAAAAGEWDGRVSAIRAWAHASIRDYRHYVALDLIALTRADCGDIPIAAAFDVFEELGDADAFSTLLTRELKVQKKKAAAIRETRAEILREAVNARG